MDKKIEEMIKDMCEEYPKECNECPCGGTCANEQIAYDLIDKGYRKIPENAVVLTEGKYSDLLSAEVKEIERDIAEYWATQDIDIVAKELHKDGYRKLDDHAICVLRKAKCLEEKMRKETAEKFAERLKAKYGKSCSEYYPELITLNSEQLDEICKEITEDKV